LFLVAVRVYTDSQQVGQLQSYSGAIWNPHTSMRIWSWNTRFAECRHVEEEKMLMNLVLCTNTSIKIHVVSYSFHL